MNLEEAGAMSDRDLLIRIANDSDHTKKSVDKLWKKSDELGTTMTAMRTLQDTTCATVDKISDAVFTSGNSLTTRVSVLESKRSGSSGQHSIRIPAPVVPVIAAIDGGKVIKMLGGILFAIVAAFSAWIATK